MPMTESTDYATLPHCLGERARTHGQRIAATFVDDNGLETSWTYQEVWSRACQLASRLPPTTGMESAPRALLLFPPGIEFLAGFLGCQLAGWIPVPTCYPKPRRQMPRLDSAAADCRPAAIVADQATLDGMEESKLGVAARGLPTIATDGVPPNDAFALDPSTLSIDPEALALLQYTSGSTSEPKGVMVTHRAMMANLEAIRCGFSIDFQDDQDRPECGVFWLPFFHDMGLIGGMLAPLYVGGRTVLMSPRAFLRRPVTWLKRISDYRATISGAPNFAYQLCVERISPDDAERLDLSGWKIAFSGAEPVLPRTLEAFANRFSACGFSAESFYPCYGLAEATLLAAGGDGPATPDVISVDRESLSGGRPKLVSRGGPGSLKLVSCGAASLGTELRIVDPQSRREVRPGSVGEIWLRGASVSHGYWNRAQENEARFQVSLADSDGDCDAATFCRTGDLGFVHDSKLFITGRIKDVIILRGRNLFPQDIELSVREAIGKEAGLCVALSVDGGQGESLAIVAETPRHVDESVLPEMARTIRRAVIEVHDVDPGHVWLVRPATVPVTSSGKVQRSRCRDQFITDAIKTRFRYDRRQSGEQSPIPIPELPQELSVDDHKSLVETTEQWMTNWLVVRAGVDPDEIHLDKPFAEYGLDSLAAVEMSGEIQDWSDVELTPAVAWNHPTVSRMSEFIADQLVHGGFAGGPAEGSGAASA